MDYHHFSDKTGFVKETARILKTGGCLYIVNPRFPFPTHKTLNWLLKLLKIIGKFFTSKGIVNDFNRFGIIMENAFYDGIIQVVKLNKTE